MVVLQVQNDSTPSEIDVDTTTTLSSDETNNFSESASVPAPSDSNRQSGVTAPTPAPANSGHDTDRCISASEASSPRPAKDTISRTESDAEDHDGLNFLPFIQKKTGNRRHDDTTEISVPTHGDMVDTIARLKEQINQQEHELKILKERKDDSNTMAVTRPKPQPRMKQRQQPNLHMAQTIVTQLKNRRQQQHEQQQQQDSDLKYHIQELVVQQKEMMVKLSDFAELSKPSVPSPTPLSLSNKENEKRSHIANTRPTSRSLLHVKPKQKQQLPKAARSGKPFDDENIPDQDPSMDSTFEWKRTIQDLTKTTNQLKDDMLQMQSTIESLAIKVANRMNNNSTNKQQREEGFRSMQMRMEQMIKKQQKQFEAKMISMLESRFNDRKQESFDSTLNEKVNAMERSIYALENKIDASLHELNSKIEKEIGKQNCIVSTSTSRQNDEGVERVEETTDVSKDDDKETVVTLPVNTLSEQTYESEFVQPNHVWTRYNSATAKGTSGKWSSFVLDCPIMTVGRIYQWTIEFHDVDFFGQFQLGVVSSAHNYDMNKNQLLSKQQHGTWSYVPLTGTVWHNGTKVKTDLPGCYEGYTKYRIHFRLDLSLSASTSKRCHRSSNESGGGGILSVMMMQNGKRASYRHGTDHAIVCTNILEEIVGYDLRTCGFRPAVSLLGSRNTISFLGFD